MTAQSGSIIHLRSMAARCRRAAEEKSGAEARELLALAESCERRLTEREDAQELVASEED
jgi:hypothetical protein